MPSGNRVFETADSKCGEHIPPPAGLLPRRSLLQEGNVKSRPAACLPFKANKRWFSWSAWLHRRRPNSTVAPSLRKTENPSPPPVVSLALTSGAHVEMGTPGHFLWLEREGPAVRKLTAPLGLHSWVPWAAAGMPTDHSCLHSPPTLPPQAHLPLAGAIHSSWSLGSALLSFHFYRHFLQASGTSRHHSGFTNQAASLHCPPLW